MRYDANYMKKFNAAVDRVLNQPLPEPEIWSDGGDPNWHDDFVRIEFTTKWNNIEYRHIYKRADGWLYNIQTNPQGRKLIQFMNPINPETHFGSVRTMGDFFDQMTGAKFVRDAAAVKQPCAVRA